MAAHLPHDMKLIEDPKDWVRLELMMSPDGKQIHAIGGDRRLEESDEPDGSDTPYIGFQILTEVLERAKRKKGLGPDPQSKIEITKSPQNQGLNVLLKKRLEHLKEQVESTSVLLNMLETGRLGPDSLQDALVKLFLAMR